MPYTMDEKYKLIKEKCLVSKEINPIHLLNEIMSEDFIAMHGPEHHVLDGACLLTCYYNVTEKEGLAEALDELSNRSIKMPGAMCGNWGVCGASASVGASLSILNHTTVLSTDDGYKINMELTSTILNKMSKIGGARCCKRNAFISLITASEFIKKYFGVELDIDDEIECVYSDRNSTCLKEKCPFNQKNR